MHKIHRSSSLCSESISNHEPRDENIEFTISTNRSKKRDFVISGASSSHDDLDLEMSHQIINPTRRFQHSPSARSRGEEKLIAVARHIAETLGNTDKAMADDIPSVVEGFNVSSEQPKQKGEFPLEEIGSQHSIRDAHYKPGMKLGVVGLGGLGNVAVKMAKAFGAEVTVFSTTTGKKEESLERLKADHFIVSKQNRCSLLRVLVGALKPQGKLVLV
ncbi:hypothetical protein LXL04_021460 [Taraxacum kok-saghyz]